MKNLSAAYCLYVTIAGSTASCLLCILLLDTSIKGMLLLLSAAAACLALVRASAATRHLLWTTTVLGLLLLPMFALLLPEWRVLPEWLLVENRIEERMLSETIDGDQTFPASDETDRGEPDPPVKFPMASQPLSAIDRPMGAEYSLQISDSLRDAKLSVEPICIRLGASVILVTWSVGLLIGLIPMILSLFRLHRLERAARCNSVLDPKIARRIKSICHRLGIRVPNVILGPKDAMPMVWTFRRSRLMLPSDVTQWSRSKLTAVLLHELIHIRRHDPLVCWLALVARALNWFNPVAWYAVKRLRIECEQSCDDDVLRLGVEPSDYASYLLELSTNQRVPDTAGPLALAIASRSLVEGRIVAILNEKRNRQVVTFHRVFGTLMVGLIFAALLATVATRAAASKASREDETTQAESSLEEAAEFAPSTQPYQEPEGLHLENTPEDSVLVDKAAKLDAVDQQNPDKNKFELIELSLEQCIVYALNNTRVIKPLPGTERSKVLREADDKAKSKLSLGASRLKENGVEDALSDFDSQFASFQKYNTENRARELSPAIGSGRSTDDHIGTLPQMPLSAFNNTPIQSGGAGNTRTDAWKMQTKKFAAEAQHPLVRGRGTLPNNSPIVLARANEDISIWQYEERIRNLVRDVEFAYWDLHAAYYRFDAAKAAVDCAAVAWKTSNAKVSPSAKNAEAQARVIYHQFKAQLDSTIAGDSAQGNEPGLYGREQNLRLLMGWATSDGRLIRPADKPGIGRADFDWESIREETLHRNIDLRQQKWSIKQRELELVSSKNQALPDIKLGMNYRYLGSDSVLTDRLGANDSFPQGRPKEFDERFGGRYREGGGRRQLDDVKNKQLALAREHRILAAKEIAAIHRLSALWQQVDELHKQITQHFQSLQATQTLVEVSQAKFDTGDSDNFDGALDNLGRALQTRSTASLNFIRGLIEYNKSLVELHAIKGTLLDYNNMQIDPASQSPK